ncbi:MAG: hypothetical protein SYR96_29665 [Actinomycetota bacterium]|nr:hypothetical protein [Actinomycetota bacterium]
MSWPRDVAVLAPGRARLEAATDDVAVAGDTGAALLGYRSSR